MAVTNINIDLDENTDYTLSLVHIDDTTNLPKDLTGYLAELTVRRALGDPVKLITLTSSSGITLGGATGTIDAKITSTDIVSSLTQGSWNLGAYDLLIKPSTGNKVKIAEGFVTLNKTSSLTI